MMVAVLGKATLLAAATAARRSNSYRSSPLSSFVPSLAAAMAAASYRSTRSSTTAAAASAATTDDALGYLNARDAAALDAELMSSPGFSLEQLMELAGLSVAEAVYDVVVGPAGEAADDVGGGGKRTKRALLVCG